MNTSLYISSGALQAFQQKLDTAANNVANVDTTGYKRRDQSFSEILANQIYNHGRTGNEAGRLTPKGIRVGYGARPGMTQLDVSQGTARQTGNPLDFMIKGKGFFQIGYPNGDIRYTRDGSFHLSPNPNGSGTYLLANANGGYLLDQDGEPIELDSPSKVSFGGNGQIIYTDDEGKQIVAPQRIALVDIQDSGILKNAGGNEFVIDEAVLPNGQAAENYINLIPEGESVISSGYLEGSNVDLSKEMTDLMTTQRSYQMNARAVSYADQMTGIANNILK